MPKFFVENNQINNGTIIITGEDVNHIVNVLRLQKQDDILVCDKEEGVTYKTKITEIEKEQVYCKIVEKLNETTESNVKVTIFQGLPKFDKMEYMIQKATELGVIKIVPVAMRRCVVKLNMKDEEKKIDRWQKIAEVAAKQSGRDRIPKIENVIKFEKIRDKIEEFDLFLVAYEEEQQLTLREVLQSVHMKTLNLKIGIVIGPEGRNRKTRSRRLKTKRSTSNYFRKTYFKNRDSLSCYFV